ncbi:hypothetical protein E6C50_01985 [Flavobacterium supellecticarium]|uniref:Thioredoxin domain-containing protein n=1 Tax=Flavobacterium supellecticarium TaxID=2565924 RepID=A0A4S4A3J7_9FLAO|nr:thioredoxin-like domain-containing protein [Flavobacterium supellecticarium]THF53001.1 hypothetical protein E6C50_01985 [Flavobacterium supellecticarium]
MKNYIIFLIQIIAFQFAIGQNANIIIKGRISNEAPRSFSDDFWFYDEYNLLASNAGDVYPFHLDNGKFEVRLVANEPYGYFRCRAVFLTSQLLDLYLMQPGDSIFMDIQGNDKVLFSGKGSEKLNYQSYAARIASDANFISHKDTVKYGKLDYPSMKLKKIQDGINLCIDSLKKLNKIADDMTIEILRVNTLSNFSKLYVASLGSIYPSSNEKEKQFILNYLQTIILQQQTATISNEKILKNCPAYQNLLYYTQLYYDRLILNNSIVNAVKIHSTYNSFEKNYTGLLRDKLITALLIQQDRDDQSLPLAENALTFLTDQRSKFTIAKFVNSRKSGFAAYPFIFETIDGNNIKLDDFKGKLLIIDSWYYGCTNCAILSHNLAPVVKKYKNSDKVTFLSVNVDRDKVKFKKGIESGLYGEKGVLHVWTKGNGEKDPFIKHYQYYGYPNILIIDENGNVLTANPFETGEEAAKKIDEIIKNNI